MRRIVRVLGLATVLAGLGPPGLTPEATAQRTPASASRPLAPMEDAYQSARYWDDQLRLARSLGTDSVPGGPPLAVLRDSLRAYGAQFRRLLAKPPGGLGPEDRRALAALQEAAAGGIGDSVAVSPASAGESPPALAALTDSVLADYGRAANRIIVGSDTLNRLAILGRLAHVDDPADRRRLFLALAPVWRSINGDDGPASPYRTLLRLRRASWGDSASPIEQKGPAFGLTSVQLEEWLTGALDRWRATTPDTLVEPWDWYYVTGAASRRLHGRIPTLTDIRRVNDRYYDVLGASPARLRIRYDLEPRPGKYPVAYTDFGSRNRSIAGGIVPGEPAVFASYLDGGLDNLAELLHETGHAIHIAAIHTRPAFTDWPDNDTFTEALADLPALELYEPAWQRSFLGDSAPLGESLRAKYAGIVFDIAWALFEIRVHRMADPDPNRIWTDITTRYLHIRPHPEWSWWAMRGQLIDAPGYLVNYALGAFLVADMRARVTERWGGFAEADARMYPRLTASLYRFGLDRTARKVLETFLGRPPRPDALLADMGRMTP